MLLELVPVYLKLFPRWWEVNWRRQSFWIHFFIKIDNHVPDFLYLVGHEKIAKYVSDKEHDISIFTTQQI